MDGDGDGVGGVGGFARGTQFEFVPILFLRFPDTHGRMVSQKGASMLRRRVDPGVLEGAELDRWYRRSPSEIEAEREATRADRYQTFFSPTTDDGPSRSAPAASADGPTKSVDGGWTEARVTVRPPAPVLRPGGVRIGSPGAMSPPPRVGNRGSFFDSYRPVPNPALGPAYITDLPSPLNVVTPRLGEQFELGDGSLVEGVAEVERLHAEQQRRIRGEAEVEPAARVRAVNRLKDGYIPRAYQIEKGRREKDITCHPFGGWEIDPSFASRNSERSRRYESQITRATGLDYVVRIPGENPVKFDGCAVWDPRRELLEAKGPGYAGLIGRGTPPPWSKKLPLSTKSQVDKQATAARGRPVDWHVAEPAAVPFFSGFLSPHPTMRALHTPPR